MSDRLLERARQILKSERGTIRKEWGGRTPICLIYPNWYYVGMSNLGFQTIYGLLNDHPRLVCERAFLPTNDDLAEIHRRNRRLRSLESHRPLADFEILAFSVSFENDFINILTILNLAGIPLESSKRTASDPLIIAGGVSIFLNPEPLADFIDVFLIGEAEEMLPDFMERYQEACPDRTRREDFLISLATLEGAYVPRFYRPLYDKDGFIRELSVTSPFPKRIQRRYVPHVDAFSTASVILTPHTEFPNMMLLEVNRGCPRRCLFCSACAVHQPYRNRSFDHLIRSIAEPPFHKARIGLTGAAVSDYPGLDRLCESIVSQGRDFSLASVRLDRVTQSLARALKKGGLKTVTLAPEAGSERLRRLIQKDIHEDDIFRATEFLLDSGFVNFRLYFLVGIPSETKEDVEAIVQLTRRIKHRMLQSAKNTRRLGRLTLSINGLVPKPSTPFQWAPFEVVDSLLHKLRTIQNGLKKEANVQVTHDVPKWAYIQSLLSRGDRRVGRMLLAAHQARGDWKRALHVVDLNPDFFVYRDRSRDEIFPWDFIDHGVTKDRLWEQYVRAVKKQTP
jgi:radical SAM superfamily enzyme YgiQ (UPF0313 family)